MEASEVDKLHPVPDESIGGAAKTNPGSLAARLKEQHEQLQQERHLDLPIPGYNGDLVARYKPLDWDFFKKIGVRTEKSKNPRKELYAQADTLIESCEEIFAVDDKGVLVSLYKVMDISGDEPVRYDERLAEAFGLKVGTARDSVFGLFNNDIAITNHHNEVAEWMQDTSGDSDGDFSGG